MKVERVVENPVVRTNIIEKPVYIERIVEKEVIVPVEKIIEVPVEKVVEIPVEVIVENPVIVQKEIIKEVFYDRNVNKPMPAAVTQNEDRNLRTEYELSQTQVNSVKLELSKLRAELESLSKRRVDVTLHQNIDYTSQNRVLRDKIAELERQIVGVRSRPSAVHVPQPNAVQTFAGGHIISSSITQSTR